MPNEAGRAELAHIRPRPVRILAADDTPSSYREVVCFPANSKQAKKVTRWRWAVSDYLREPLASRRELANVSRMVLRTKDGLRLKFLVNRETLRRIDRLCESMHVPDRRGEAGCPVCRAAIPHPHASKRGHGLRRQRYCTYVVHVRDVLARLRAIAELKVPSPSVIYIGRANARFGLKASIWANPFKVDDHGRDAALARYREYITQRIESEPERYDLAQLRGKTLACWCAPEPCHGDVLAELANQIRP